MKIAGIVIMLIGLLITVVTGFSYVNQEKVVDAGQLEGTKEKDHQMLWSPDTAVFTKGMGGDLCSPKTKKI